VSSFGRKKRDKECGKRKRERERERHAYALDQAYDMLKKALSLAQ
jgi:hypothetical protein